MSRLEAWLSHGGTILVGGTGLVYAWMRYFLHPVDPFAVVNHPLQPLVQHAHIVVAPLLVFAAGLEWQRHAWKYWRRGIRKHRRSGVALLLALAPMVASGYLIQTASDGGWRKVWVGIHLAASGLWLAGYLIHQLVHQLPRYRRARANAG